VVAQDRGKWLAVVNTVMNFRAHKTREIRWLAERWLASQGRLCSMACPHSHHKVIFFFHFLFISFSSLPLVFLFEVHLLSNPEVHLLSNPKPHFPVHTSHHSLLSWARCFQPIYLRLFYFNNILQSISTPVEVVRRKCCGHFSFPPCLLHVTPIPRSLILSPNGTAEPGYNDICLCDTSSITSDILWYQLTVTVNRNIILLGYNNTRL
jgi:hypothetical protein